MVEKRTEIIENVLRFFLKRSLGMPVICSVDLNDEQKDSLQKLCNFAVIRAFQEEEVLTDPRKNSYIANSEIKIALVAILLTYALINPLSLRKYTKEYFERSIQVYTDKQGNRCIDFDSIEDSIVEEALHKEIIYDWIVYRDAEGKGIRALSDEKTMNMGIEDFKSGGDPIYEFARFERMYFIDKQKQLKKDKQNAQATFRDAIIQQAAIEIAKQQILAHQNPINLVKLLFDAKDYNLAIDQILHWRASPSIQTRKEMLTEQKNGKANPSSVYHELLDATFEEE